MVDTGFDYVVYFQQKRSEVDPKVWKWFRVWKSGYLEHGGIISKDPSAAASLGDELVC